MRFLIQLLGVTIALATFLRADDIQTLDGKVYKDVKILSKTSTAISILYQDGGAQIAVINLPPELQKKYGFDPLTAKKNADDEAARLAKQAQEEKAAAALERASLMVTGHIIQVLPDGILAELHVQKYEEVQVSHSSTSDAVPDELGHAPTYTTQKWTETQYVNRGFDLGTGFVQCDSSGLTDDGQWSGKIWYIGTYSYDSVGAGYKTVHKYTNRSDVFEDAQGQTETVKASTQENGRDAARDSGTGFFVTSSGYMLTAYHVVKSSTAIKVRKSDGTLVDVKLVSSDPINDVAVLKAEGRFDFLPISDLSNVKLGETVITIGFPNTLIQGLAPKLTKGEISSMDGMQDDPRMFQISVPVQPGNSGGCLVDENGNVIGIITSKLDALNVASATGDIPQNVNYALKISYAQLLINGLSDAHKDLAPMSTSVLPFTDTVAKVNQASAQVLAY
jgi:S1-C subfamily serine protease